MPDRHTPHSDPSTRHARRSRLEAAPALSGANLGPSDNSSCLSLDQPLLTVDGVAELLAMSPSSVYYLKDNGALPYVLLGKRIRFSKQDIEQYLAGCRRGPRAA
jgi:excisionase family DNA binding protein